MGGRTPLRRRRLGGGGRTISGGNPNEPDEGGVSPEPSVVGPGLSSSLHASSTAASAAALPLHQQAALSAPSHHIISSPRYSNDMGIMFEERGIGKKPHGLSYHDAESDKIHDGPGQSYLAGLRRTITSSIQSNAQVFGRDSNSGRSLSNVAPRIIGGMDGETRSMNTGLSILDASIERRDWRAVVSIASSPAGVSLASRRSYAPLFYEGRFGTTLLPLHRACMYSPPANVVETLIRAYPDAARTAESTFNRLPLHLACRSGFALVDTIQMLLMASGGSSAARYRDKLGRIPLHYCLANGAHPSIVSDLVAAYPACLSISDCEGWLPLHVACGSGVDLAIIENLVRSHPQTIGELTRWGSQPLDCARMFVGERYARKVAELFSRGLDTLGISSNETYEEEEGRWDGVSVVGAAPVQSSREGISFTPTSRFA